MNTSSRLTFKVECLTPVHVGSGDELVQRVDFHFIDGATEIFDLERLLEILPPSGDGAPDRVVDQMERRVQELRRRPGFDLAPYRLHRITGQLRAQRLRIAIRAADGRPLIPGSSIKGALRTLILTGLTGENGPHSKRSGEGERAIRAAIAKPASPKFKAQPLENDVFRGHTQRGEKPDAKTDLLRMLAVPDAAFGPDSLEVLSTVAVGTSRTTLTAVEALKQGAAAALEMRLGDDFAGPRFFSRETPPLSQIAEWSRTHAKFLLEGDRDFFRQRNEQRLTARLDGLLARLGRAHDGEILLRLGWGTGWRTMTGDILSNAERDRVMRRVGKTRKVILDGHSDGSARTGVLGWIKLTPISAQEAARLYRETAPPPVEPPPVQPLPPPQPKIPDIDPFEQRVNALTARDIGRVQGLYDQATRTEDLTRRSHRLDFLAERLTALWGHDRRRIRRFAATMPELAPLPRSPGANKS